MRSTVRTQAGSYTRQTTQDTRPIGTRTQAGSYLMIGAGGEHCGTACRCTCHIAYMVLSGQLRCCPHRLSAIHLGRGARRPSLYSNSNAAVSSVGMGTHRTARSVRRR